MSAIMTQKNMNYRHANENGFQEIRKATFFIVFNAVKSSIIKVLIIILCYIWHRRLYRNID